MVIYRKKACCVNAKQWLPPDVNSKASLTEDSLGVLYAGEDSAGPFGFININGDRIVVHPNDWIVESCGEKQVLKQDDFESLYEPTTDDLPHCWRLSGNGELISDVPIVPGMIVWHLYPHTVILQENAPWKCKVMSIYDSAYVSVKILTTVQDLTTSIISPDEDELYYSLEAAKVGMKKIEEEDIKRTGRRGFYRKFIDKYQIPEKHYNDLVKFLLCGKMSECFKAFVDKKKRFGRRMEKTGHR